VGLWAKLLEIRYQYLYPGILLFCILGAYSLNQSVFDVTLMVLFGIVGYVFRKLDWPLAPAILALILGPMMERSLRTSLEMSGGDLFIFFQRPISAVLLILAIIILVTSAVRLMPMWARKESKN
jgi:putative tricarboxylic transport membrane protein